MGVLNNFFSYIKVPGITKSCDVFGITTKSLKVANTATNLNKVSNKNKVMVKAKTKTKIKSKTKVASPKKYDIVNIALFGIDKLNEKAIGRADATIVLTMDFTRKKLKVTSFMRDLYVHIDGHGYTKLGHAYAYGGPKLAMKTINQNFGLDIKDYCTLDFFTMAKVIDVLGGVKINVKADEIKLINTGTIVPVSKKINKKLTLIKKAGVQILSGNQAVAYSRIRYLGRGDFDRTERQRTEMLNLVKDINSRGGSALSNLFTKIKPYLKTNFSDLDYMILGLNYFKIQPVPIVEERFPVDGYWKAVTIKGVQYLKADLKVLKAQVTRYINKDIKLIKIRNK